MKLLILSDLHFVQYNPISDLKKITLGELAQNNHFDAVLSCGDNAELTSDYSNHRTLFKFLRKTFDCEIGIIPGNHDLWGKQFGISSPKLLYEIFPKLTEEEGIVYLETTTLKIEDYTIIGSYGHYDYSLAQKNEIVTEEAIKAMSLFYNGIYYEWSDKIYMSFGRKNDKTICKELSMTLEERIKNISDNIILLTHGVPLFDLIGHPNSLKNDFLAAYSGSKRFAKLCFKYPIDYYFFGHTHAHAEGKINNTLAINVGSDYNNLSYYILDTEKAKAERFLVDFI